MTIQIQTRRFTIDEYHKMIQADILTENDRVELLDGEIVEMSPIGSRYAACVDRLNRLFILVLGQQVIVRVQNPIRLSERSEPEPDLALVEARPDFYAEAHPEPEDVLLLIEVADTSATFDRSVKLPLYAQASIVEVWLIDLSEKRVEVYRQPSAQGYQSVQQLGSGQNLAPLALPEIKVAIAEILGYPKG